MSTPPRTHRLDVTTSGVVGAHSKVELDGADIGEALCGISIDLRVGDIPQVTLDVVVVDLSTGSGEVAAIIPDASHELLVRLGWTPPAED